MALDFSNLPPPKLYLLEPLQSATLQFYSQSELDVLELGSPWLSHSY